MPDQITQMERPDWHPVTKEEWLELRPYILDCSDLPGTVCRQVREEFRAAGIAGLKGIARDLDRAPTQEEADKLRRAVVRYFNEVRIPEISAAGGGAAPNRSKM